jgi:hypothetical protein
MMMVIKIIIIIIIIIITQWPESTSEQYRPSDHRLSAKLVSIFADRGCHMVSVTDTYYGILGFLDRISNNNNNNNNNNNKYC